MELDFSKIDNLGSTYKPAEGKIEPRTQALQRKADNRHKQLEDSARVLQEYQKNKRLITELVAEINHGVQQGIDIYDLFIKAVEALAYATNDKELHKRTRDNLKAVYGIGLKEPRALELEKEDTQKRLERLLQALNNADRVEDKERLKKAITAHQKHLKTLQA